MALQTFQSPFALNTSLWSSEELLTYNTAYARAEKIQLSIDQIFSNIVNITKFEEEFPALALSMKALVIPLKDTNLPDELKWIKEDVMKLFKSKKTIAITTQLAHKIAKAQEGITEYLENYNNDETNKLAASIFFIQDFFTHYKLYLQNNQQAVTQPKIFNILNGTTSQGSIDDNKFLTILSSIDEMIESLNDVLLSKLNIDAQRYKKLLTPALSVILIAAQALIEPNQYTSMRGDNPLSIGLALKHNQEHAQLQAMTKSEEFKQLTLSVIERSKLVQRYIKAKDEVEQYTIALEILNSPPAENPYETLRIEHFALPVRLSLLRVLSSQSKEFPQYFKTLAMDLCQQIGDLKIKEPAKPIDQDLDSCTLS